MSGHHRNVETLSVGANRSAADRLSADNESRAVRTTSANGCTALDREYYKYARARYSARRVQTDRGKAGRTNAQ
jgi:hypothetical protein